jgi:phosphoribosylaminoimidazole-succinocarboxamide synthase
MQKTSAEQIQEAFRKSDGNVSMVGEVATDEVALNMLKFAMTGSIFTAFTNHKDTVGASLKTNLLYEGKSKQVFEGGTPDTCLIHFKDDATAGNGEKHDTLKGKGRLNAAISNLIYGYLEENGVKTHLLRALSDTDIVAHKVTVLPLEVIVRNVAAGSFSKKYGVAEGEPLKSKIVEFSLKDDALGDPMLAPSHIYALGLASEADVQYLTAQALLINALLTKLFEKCGIRLIDFKIEFGRSTLGAIILCDEFSPDSCRLWDAETNKKLDKDRFRRDLGGVLEGYADVLERLRAVLSV